MVLIVYFYVSGGMVVGREVFLLVEIVLVEVSFGDEVVVVVPEDGEIGVVGGQSGIDDAVVGQSVRVVL